jgi:hypothetical protein
MIRDNTPLEEYTINGCSVLVKREDLCCPEPGPSFSKIRGAFAHIQSRPESTIGVLDTFHSKAGWAVSFLCGHLGKKCINYYPVYRKDTALRSQQQRAWDLGARLEPLTAGMSAVLFHQAKRHLREGFPDSYMMPNALKLSESVAENAKEAQRSDLPLSGTIVISISSGTVAAGVLCGAPADLDCILHMGYSRSENKIREYVGQYTDRTFRLIDEGYTYKDQAKCIDAPFPCNPYYDLKAWMWLVHNIQALRQPIVFWNIGA